MFGAALVSPKQNDLLGVPAKPQSSRESVDNPSFFPAKPIFQIRLLALFVLLALHAFSQTAQLTGKVSDNTGAVLVGAAVVATNINTGVARNTVTNEAGNYLITALLPGSYRVTAAKGFKEMERQPVTLAVDEVGRIDFTMQVGEARQTVTVSESAVLLDTATSTVANVVENVQVSETPLNGRDPIDLLGLSTGVRIQGGFGGKNGSWGNFSSNGGLANANVVMVEGLALDLAQMNAPAFVPPVDSTQEFRVQTNDFNAEYGRTAGAVVNFSIKSGTNELHGSLYEYLRNTLLNANNFFQNEAGAARPVFKQNQFGASIGGPIKKDKVFYFANWEDYRNRQSSPSITTVPAALQRAGNFSQTFTSSGQMVVVADPGSSYQLADGTWTRDPFPGNIIPASRFSTVASHVSQIYPQPDVAGNPLTNVNNFDTVGGGGTNEHQIVTKLDENYSSKWKFFGTFSRIWGDNTSIDPLGYKVNLTDASTYDRTHATVSAVAVFSPSLVGEFHSGFARLNNPSVPYALGYDITQLGFPQTLANETQIKSFPGFSVQGLVGVGTSGSAQEVFLDLNSWGQRAAMTWVKGSHTVKWGVDYRVEQLDQFQQNSLEPLFQFNNQFTATNPLSLNANSGIPYASFLLGDVASASVGNSQRLANERKYLGFFIQDAWKIGRKLTVNIGTDYSLEFPITERFNRKMWFDSSASIPIQVGFPVTGGFEFATPSERSPYNLDTKQFGPRLGLAYQLLPHTVVRSGFGMFWIPAAITEVTGDVRAPAWDISTQMLTSLNNGITPYNTLDNPFPQGILTAPGSSAGLLTLLGQNAAANQRFFHTGYMGQWNFDVQQELGRDMVLEVIYAGSTGVGLPAEWASQMNQLPDKYLSMGAALQQQVPNPFASVPSIVAAGGPLSLPTVQAGQLLRPYPQFQTLYVEGDPLGHSGYNSFQLQLKKRFASSVVALGYTDAKCMGDTESRSDWLEGGSQGTSMGFMDAYNRRLDRSICVEDVSQRLTFNYSLNIPFGKGHRLLNNFGFFNRFVDGWQVSGLYTAQTGTPAAVGTNTNLTGSYNAVTDVYGSYDANSRPNESANPSLSGSATSRLNEWFNTYVFSQPPPYTYGDAPRTLPNVRWDGTSNLDLGLFKNNKFGHEERFNLQFRAELFNVANHVRFGIADMFIGDPTFGVVSSQANNPRQVQFALKLLF